MSNLAYHNRRYPPDKLAPEILEFAPVADRLIQIYRIDTVCSSENCINLTDSRAFAPQKYPRATFLFTKIHVFLEAIASFCLKYLYY